MQNKYDEICLQYIAAAKNVTLLVGNCPLINDIFYTILAQLINLRSQEIIELVKYYINNDFIYVYNFTVLRDEIISVQSDEPVDFIVVEAASRIKYINAYHYGKYDGQWICECTFNKDKIIDEICGHISHIDGGKLYLC